MRKYLQSIVPAFLSGTQFAHYATCSIRNGVFYSYETPIAVRKIENGQVVVYLSAAKFSKTTTTQLITLDPKLGYLVQTRIIDGHKYILISADAGLEVNGISVSIE